MTFQSMVLPSFGVFLEILIALSRDRFLRDFSFSVFV